MGSPKLLPDHLRSFAAEAEDPSTPVDRLLVLAELPNHQVSLALLRNPMLPAEVLAVLADRYEELSTSVAVQVATHKRLPLWSAVRLVALDGALFGALPDLAHRDSFEVGVALSLWLAYESSGRCELLVDHIAQLSQRLGDDEARRKLALRMLPSYRSSSISSYHKLLDDLDLVYEG